MDWNVDNKWFESCIKEIEKKNKEQKERTIKLIINTINSNNIIDVCYLVRDIKFNNNLFNYIKKLISNKQNFNYLKALYYQNNKKYDKTKVLMKNKYLFILSFYHFGKNYYYMKNNIKAKYFFKNNKDIINIYKPYDYLFNIYFNEKKYIKSVLNYFYQRCDNKKYRYKISINLFKYSKYLINLIYKK